MKSSKRDSDFDIYKNAFKESDNALILINSQGITIDTNKSFIKLYGFNNNEDIKGRHFTSFFQSSFSRNALISALARRKNWRGQIEVVNNSGAILEMHLTVSLIKNSKNDILYGLGAITEAIKKNKCLSFINEYNDYYPFLTEKTHDGYWVIEPSGKIIECNTNVCKIFGCSKKEIIGKSISTIETMKTIDEMKLYLKMMIKGETIQYKSKHRKKNGELISADITGMYWKPYKKFIFFIRYITDEDQLLRKLNKTSRSLDELNMRLQTVMSIKILIWKKTRAPYSILFKK